METAVFEEALATSEQRRILAVEAAGIGDWTYDVARGTLVCSPVARAMHGVAPGESLTIALHDALIHADDRPRVQAERARAMDPTGSGHYHVAFRFRLPNGEIRWIESVGQSVFADTDAGRRARYVLGAMVDVTARERAATAIEAERARLADIVRIAPAFMAVLRGPHHVIELTNSGFDALVGGREVRGRTVAESLPEAVEQGFVALLDEVLATGEPFVGREITYRRPGAKGDDICFVDVVFQTLTEGDGVRTGIFVHGVDITEQVRARAEVERLLVESERARGEAEAARTTAETARRRAESAGRDAELANKAKSGFLATMSHELRTPLNAMLGYTQLLELGIAGPLTDRQRGFLERLTASCQHLLGLVNDILDLSKIEAGEARVARRDSWTGPPLGAALDLVRLQASAKGIALVDARPDEMGIPFVGDEDRVRQIVLNLLSNAVKFTPEGGMVTVTCDTVAGPPDAGRQEPPNVAPPGTGPWATIEVADTGVGIAPEEQGRIFDPFHQVEGGHTRTAGGSGLGLAISRRLARLMGGDLTVTSTLGVGSTFTLWLPATHVAGEVQLESAAERAARAEREVAQLHAPGVGAVGEVLRATLDDVLTAYADRLRDDPLVPRARTLSRIQLEDHQATFLADLAQSLVIVDEAGPEAEAELRDGSNIQRAIADAHGARRFAQGFSEAALRRDLRLFREEVERAVRSRLQDAIDVADTGEHPDIEAAVRVLLGLLDRAEALSLRAWHRTASGA